MAGSAQSLYRRHRPRSFADVVGQAAVVRTLSNAVQRGGVHHAYLFVGSRGTGKTSTAKILASCLNCESGPTVDPCGACDSCRAIASAMSLDVIEMDAASNNSVEDIRELRESVMLAPVSGRHKVYILDEAHMLSQAAWNAFLKTLEEPPPHTVFVLATTEAGKVPATVVDRCHRFDFQRPTVEEISKVLVRVASAESIEIPPEALAAIARSATGSFRDALGTLEQLVTYSGREIALADVLDVLGVADEQLLADAFDAVRDGDARAALLAVARCVEGGRDSSSFIRDLEGRARELLIVQTLQEVPRELSLTPEIDERLLGQARRLDGAQVVRMLDLLGHALEAVRAGADPRTQLELALVKAATPQIDGSSRALLARIERLERTLLRTGAASVATADVVDQPAASSAEPLARPETETPVERETAPASLASDDPPVEREAAPASLASDDPPVERETAPASLASDDPPVERGAALASVASDDPPAREQALEIDMLALWPAALESVKAENELLWAVVSHAVPESRGEDELILTFAPSATAPNAAFLKRKAEDPTNRTILADTLQRLTGRRRRVSFELGEIAETEHGVESMTHSEEEIVARLIAELDAEELPEDWLVQQQKGSD